MEECRAPSPAPGGMIEAVHEGMGTVMAHRAFGPAAGEAIEAVRREAGRLERLLSRFLPDSGVARLSAAAGCAPVGVDPEVFEALRLGAEFSALSGGLFDPTIAPLCDLWDFRRAVRPPEAAVDRERALVGFRDLALDPFRQTARLARPGQAVDLGGIAKGYAGDAFLNVFRRYRVRSALSNIGGGVSVLGARPDGAPWRVGIRHPRGDGLIGAVSAADCAVVTSGDYERCFFEGGRRFHHLIDPRTGYPADSGLISATVVADGGAAADALSTAAFVAGLERGLELIGKADGAGAVLIDGRLRVYVTRNLRGRFEGVAGLKKLMV